MVDEVNKKATMNSQFDINDCLGFLINLAGRKMQSALEEALAPLGISAPQWLILMVCMDEECNTPSKISSALQLDRAGVTRLLDHLEKKKIIKRHFNHSDRRSITTQLTPIGAKLAKYSQNIEKQVSKNFLKGISPQKVKLLKNTLHEIS